VKLHSNAKDLTQKMPAAGPGMVITINWMCGHKRSRGGGIMRGVIPWRCAACVGEKK